MVAVALRSMQPPPRNEKLHTRVISTFEYKTHKRAVAPTNIYYNGSASDARKWGTRPQCQQAWCIMRLKN